MSRAAGIMDPHAAFRLNQSRSATFWTFITLIEVGMRNKFASEIERRIDEDFFNSPDQILDPHIAKRMTRAKKSQGLRGSPNSRDGLIASLTIGFWGLLLSKRYESTFWGPALRHAFAGLGKTSRAEVHEALQTAIVLRNRIAHHENILSFDPETTLATLDWLLELLEPGSSQFAKLDQDIPLHPVE
jgi:hypothetical protein